VKRVIAIAAATVLSLIVASSAFAAKPDVFRDRSSGSEYDSFTSELCGFDVWLTYRIDFLIVIGADRGLSYFHAERFRTGPGGSLLQSVHYTWTQPENFSIVGDPDSGSWVEISHDILHGSRVWSTPERGVIYRDAGYYEVTATLTVTPDGETFEITDEVAHGQQPGTLSEEAANELLCSTLG
jgi:hypothetical protein